MNEPTASKSDLGRSTWGRLGLWAFCVFLTAAPILTLRRPPILDLPQQLHQIPLFFAQIASPHPELTVFPLAPNKLGYLPLGAAWLIGGTTWGPRLAALFVAMIWLGGLHWLGYRLRRPVSNLLLASAFLFSSPFYAGFFNFLVGMVALAFVLVDLSRPAAERSHLDLALSSFAGAMLLYFAHALWFAAGLFIAGTLALLVRFSYRECLARGLGVLPALAFAAHWGSGFGKSGWQTNIRQEGTALERLTSLDLGSSLFLGGIRDVSEQIVVLLALFWVAAGLLAARRKKEGARVDPHLAIAGLVLLGLTLFLPYKLDKTILLAWRWGPFAAAFLLLAVPEPPASPRLTRALALVTLLGLAAANLKATLLYARTELAGFDESLQAIDPGSRVIGLDFSRTGPAIWIDPTFQLFAYAALERGAELSFSFTELPTSLVVHRDPDWRPAWVLGLEWYPDYVSAGDLGHFDFALVRAVSGVRERLEASFPTLSPIAGSGEWRTYRVDRRATAALPPGTRLFSAAEFRRWEKLNKQLEAQRWK